MLVKVRLLGEFRKYLQGRAEPIVCELPDSSRISELAGHLGIDTTAEAIVGVNGQIGGQESPLADGDEVVFVSPMSGGELA